MIEIIPAILAKDFEELSQDLARIAGVARTVQIDVCDGKFVRSISWPMNANDKWSVTPILEEEQGLPYWDAIDYEFDLMVANAHEQMEFFVRLGAKRLVFHIEAECTSTEGEGTDKFKEFLESIDMYTRENVQIGLAINTTTPIEALYPFINHIDFVQCMGIENIGHQGEPFDERVLSHISALRAKYPELIISVDGSVNEDTIPKLVKASANRVIVGSALMHSADVQYAMRELEDLTG